jgi:hypothetical protein
MRIAISGSHRTGKSTLLEELASLLPTYTTVDEPYHLMEEDGHAFSHPPSIEDFEAQLARSVEEVHAAAGEDVLFDRCPVDLVAYIAAHEDADHVDLDEWLPRVREAMQTLDLVVFVPIEGRDRILFSGSDDEGGLRAAVDARLRELLLDDPHELDLPVVEVHGETESRAESVLRAIPRHAKQHGR